MLKSFFIASLMLFNLITNAYSETKSTIDDSLILDSVTVEEIEPLIQPIDQANSIGDIISILDGLIAVGKKIWPIIEAGRPVVNIKLAPAISILPNLENPNGVLSQMENWSFPEVKSYRVSIKNAMGFEVIGFTYSIIFQHSGQFQGKGKYVTSLKVSAANVHVGWGGFEFNATSELLGISNVGSLANPVASGIIQITYEAKGKLNAIRDTFSYYIDGNGKVQQLGK